MYEQLKLDNQFCFRLYSAAHLTMKAYQPYFAPIGITYPQYLVLLVLWEQDHQPVCDIAKRLLLDTNTVTPLLQRMEKAGLVIRQRGEQDTRQRIVSLTDKGIDLRDKVADVPKCLGESIMEQVGSADELKAIIPLLDQLIEGLKKIESKCQNC